MVSLMTLGSKFHNKTLGWKKKKQLHTFDIYSVLIEWGENLVFQTIEKNSSDTFGLNYK